MLTALDNSLGKAIDGKAVQSRFVSVDDDYTLGPNENIVHVTGFSGAVAITLPPVADCAGRIFAITAPDDSDTNNVTIQDQDDSYDWTDQVIDAAGGGGVFLYCDGQKFWVLHATLT